MKRKTGAGISRSGKMKLNRRTRLKSQIASSSLLIWLRKILEEISRDARIELDLICSLTANVQNDKIKENMLLYNRRKIKRNETVFTKRAVRL